MTPAASPSDPTLASASPGVATPAVTGNRFLPFVHSFRALAILSVVATHVDGYTTWPDEDALLRRLIFAFTLNGSLLFVFIAGFLFHHSANSFRYPRYLRTKFARVLLPYLIMSVPTLIYHHVVHLGIFAPGHEAPWGSTALAVLRALLTAEHMPIPYWFIPMVVFLYLGAPLFLALDRRPWFPLLLPWLLGMAMLCHRPYEVTHVLHALLYFLPCYLAGIFVSHHRERVFAVVDRWLPALLAACLGAIAVDVLVRGRGGTLYGHYPFDMRHGIVDIDLPIKLVGSLVLLALLRRCGPRLHAHLNYLAGASFGVFFLHKQVMTLLTLVARRLGYDGLPPGLVPFLVLVTLTTGLSLALVWLCRRLLGAHSVHVIGC
jgi:surface polysaccharide O-acyltransferase-like enzyme